MQSRWLFTLVVLCLFLVLMVGIPVFPELLAVKVAGWFNFGALIFLVLHLLAPALALVYLKQRQADR